VIAFEGQSLAQPPRPSHLTNSSIDAVPSFILMILSGHISAQIPQPVHFEGSIIATSFLMYLF